VPVDAERWLRELPAELAPQRHLIAALLREARRDARLRLFVVGCSIGRGAADRLSDVDALIRVSEDGWSDVIAESAAIVRRAGQLVDLYQQVIHPSSPDARAYQHTFAQYASGAQLDLVVARARDRQVPRRDWIVLHDPDGAVQREPRTITPTEEQVRQWMYNGLVHLSACAKYLVRASAWEAHLQLEAARAELWRLWAVAAHVQDPEYGVTAVLDDARRPMPAKIDATVGGLDRSKTRAAAIACVDLLIDTWPSAIAAVTREVEPPALAAWVRDQLRSVPT
jgi:predicted nucleotidyltransferase